MFWFCHFLEHDLQPAFFGGISPVPSVLMAKNLEKVTIKKFGFFSLLTKFDKNGPQSWSWRIQVRGNAGHKCKKKT